MNKQIICFSSILVLMAATVVAVPAQESPASLGNIINNNASLNTIPNQTTNANLTTNANQTTNANLTSNASVSIPMPVTTVESIIKNNTSLMETFPALNDTPSFQNATILQNATLVIEDGNNSSVTEEISASLVMPAEPKVDAVFSIGGDLKSQIFQIPGKVLPRQNYEIGMPIKPLRDTSKMMFVCDLV